MTGTIRLVTECGEFTAVLAQRRPIEYGQCTGCVLDALPPSLCPRATGQLLCSVWGKECIYEFTHVQEVEHDD